MARTKYDHNRRVKDITDAVLITVFREYMELAETLNRIPLLTDDDVDPVVCALVLQSYDTTQYNEARPLALIDAAYRAPWISDTQFTMTLFMLPVLFAVLAGFVEPDSQQIDRGAMYGITMCVILYLIHTIAKIAVRPAVQHRDTLLAAVPRIKNVLPAVWESSLPFLTSSDLSGHKAQQLTEAQVRHLLYGDDLETETPSHGDTDE